MGKDIKIILHQEGDQHHYFPGSEVKGTVVVDVDKPDELDSIAVKLIGKAEAEWKEEFGAGEDRTEKEYENSVTYFKKKYVLWSKDDSSELSVGEHTFSFEHQLSEGIPPSFKGEHGKVEYEVKAKIHQDGPNPKAKKHITVRERPDLLQQCLEPKTFEEAGRVNFLCFNFGSMSMKCDIPRTGYSPGESIPISVYLENLTTKVINIEASLKRKDTYTEHEVGFHKITRDEVNSLESPPIQPGEVTTFEGQSLQISPDTPATLRSCKFISVEYTLVINADVPMAFDKTVKIPIVIQHKE
jgi:hypothetical protein